jgi:hypothetical protein
MLPPPLPCCHLTCRSFSTCSTGRSGSELGIFLEDVAHLAEALVRVVAKGSRKARPYHAARRPRARCWLRRRRWAGELGFVFGLVARRHLWRFRDAVTAAFGFALFALVLGAFSAAAPLAFLAAAVPLMAPLLLLLVASASGGCSSGGGLRLLCLSLCFLQLNLLVGLCVSRSGRVKATCQVDMPPSLAKSTNPANEKNRGR